MENLTDLFYGLIDDGFIYDEDENGLNMSYGEYVAIAEYFHENIVRILREEVGDYTTLEKLADAFNDLMNSADDDTRMFAGIDDDNTSVYPEYYKDNDLFCTILGELEEDNVNIDYELREEE